MQAFKATFKLLGSTGYDVLQENPDNVFPFDKTAPSPLVKKLLFFFRFANPAFDIIKNTKSLVHIAGT